MVILFSYFKLYKNVFKDNDNKELYKWILILSITFLIIGVILLKIVDKEKNIENKRLFISSFYSQIESKVVMGKNGVHLRVKNYKNEITINPYLDQSLNNNLWPIEVAVIGDSIYKNSNSDTIYIIHNNDKYIYPFKIYDDSIKQVINYK